MNIEEALRSRGIPLTHQRLAIYYRLKRSKEHPSAEEIYRALKPAYPALSLATVYKTLQTFESLGLIRLVNRPHAQARYDAIMDRHHHLICGSCGRIEDVFDPRLDALPSPKAPGDFVVTDHSVHFRGLCGKCAGRRHNRRKK